MSVTPLRDLALGIAFPDDGNFEGEQMSFLDSTTLTERVEAAYLEECRETGCYLGSERKAKRRIRAKLAADGLSHLCTEPASPLNQEPSNG